MTRSSAKRQNRNARLIVAAAKSPDLSKWIRMHGAFDAEGARRFVPHSDVYLFTDMPSEINWSYCASLMNRKAAAWSSGIVMSVRRQVLLERRSYNGTIVPIDTVLADDRYSVEARTRLAEWKRRNP